MISDAGRHAPQVPAGVADPLLVTSEPGLLEELLRLCAAAEISPVVAADPAALRRAWPKASVVLLGVDLAGAARQLPRRPGVVVVGSDGDSLWRLAADVGADHVAVLPSAAGWLAGVLSAPNDAGSGQAPVVAIIGGQGGSGATALAVALSRCASRAGTSTLLVDADPFGGGVDLALGLESAAGVRWPQIVDPDEVASGVSGDLLDRLPMRDGLRLLATDRDQPVALTDAAMAGVLAAGRRRCELVVVDLPRRVDEVARVVLAAAARTYVVVPAQVRAVAAAAQLASSLREHAADVRAIVRGPAPSGLSLSAVARSLDIPLGGAVRAEPGLARDYERGVPPGQRRGPLAGLCVELLRQLAGDRPGATSDAA